MTDEQFQDIIGHCWEIEDRIATLELIMMAQAVLITALWAISVFLI
jgi:hypothetical protein